LICFVLHAMMSNRYRDRTTRPCTPSMP
jgi:hypothetical protein